MKSIVNQPFINGFQYGWSNCQVLINGTLATIGITAIAYEETTEFETIYGASNVGIGRGVGNYTYTASMSLYAEELVALQNAARIQNPLNTTASVAGLLPFDIIITYLKPDNSGLTIDKLKNVQFTNNKRDVKQGDTSISVDLTLIISHIEWGA